MTGDDRVRGRLRVRRLKPRLERHEARLRGLDEAGIFCGAAGVPDASG